MATAPQYEAGYLIMVTIRYVNNREEKKKLEYGKMSPS